LHGVVFDIFAGSENRGLISYVEQGVLRSAVQGDPDQGVHIERTLWQLKTPGRLEVPAAVAFERIICETAAKQLSQHDMSQFP